MVEVYDEFDPFDAFNPFDVYDLFDAYDPFCRIPLTCRLFYILSTRNTKIIAFFLLILAAAPVFSIVVQQRQRRNIRHRMKERLEEQMVQTVSVSDDEIRWAEKGKEVWINDRLFDIESLEHKDHLYIFQGLFDDEETILVKKINKEQQKENPPGNKLLVQLFHIFRSHSRLEFQERLSFEIQSQRFPDFILRLSQGQTTEISPPPKCCSLFFQFSLFILKF